jgi:hypothetical protein
VRGALFTVATGFIIFNSVAADRIVSTVAETLDGWKVTFPREEIKPRFAFDATHGHAGAGSLIIEKPIRATDKLVAGQSPSRSVKAKTIDFRRSAESIT